jgi:hypothetical protein
VAGRAGALSMTERISRSVKTLQEQTIIRTLSCQPGGADVDLGQDDPACKKKSSFWMDSNVR